MVGRTGNQKIIGACVIGCGLVAAAYTLSHFGVGKPLPASVGSVSAPERIAVKVEDKDNNGIEDWRDTFLTAKPIVLNEAATSTYSLPATLTGQLGISFFQNYVISKNTGPLGKSDEELVADTATAVTAELQDHIYSTSDVTIMETWTETDVKNYANAMGGLLASGKAKGTADEVYILKDIVVYGKKDRLSEFEAIEADYKKYRDESLQIPVPAPFVKNHLDLINTYNALYNDFYNLALYEADPVAALLRLNRYQDDALGFQLAVGNMNDSLKPYSKLFSLNDAALIFAQSDLNPQTP